MGELVCLNSKKVTVSMIQISLLIKTKEEYKHTENTLPFVLVESNDCSLEKPSKPPIKATEQRPNKKGRGWSSCHCFFSSPSERSDVCFCCPDTFYTIEDQKFHLKVKFKVKDYFLYV